MKFLFILLSFFTINSYAEFRVSEITNSVTGKKYCTNGCTFDTAEKAQSWIDSNKSNGSFGKSAYVKDYIMSETPVAGFSSCSNYVVDVNGVATESGVVDQLIRDALDAVGLGPDGEVEVQRCSYPDEYNTPSITDITTEINAKALLELKIQEGKLRRERCQKALDLIAGANTGDGKTEAEIDAMEAAFADIHSALKNSRDDKAKRLINLVTDENFSDLKASLLLILE